MEQNTKNLPGIFQNTRYGKPDVTSISKEKKKLPVAPEEKENIPKLRDTTETENEEGNFITRINPLVEDYVVVKLKTTERNEKKYVAKNSEDTAIVLKEEIAEALKPTGTLRKRVVRFAGLSLHR
ncbi:hypothetical protein FQR65_LT08737 [Abscondita terminalis]|nr:hypothetical protein FQR65_LT08737 [Abscondita terminalis]